MRRFLLRTTALCFFVPAIAQAADVARPQSLSVQGLYLGQTTKGFQLITAEDLPADPVQTFERDLDDLDINAVAGARISWTTLLNDQNWRISLFSTDTFTGQGTFIDNTPGESTNFSYAQNAGRDVDTENSEQAHRYDIKYRSRLSSLEAATTIGSAQFGYTRVALGSGIRSLLYTYDLDTSVYDQPLTSAAAFLQVDHVTLDGNSLMIGPQIEAEIETSANEQLTLGVSIKAGVFASVNEVTSTFQSVDFPANRLSRDKKNLTLGHALEISPHIDLKLTESLSLTANAMLLWINGFSEASKEFRVVADANRGVLADGNTFFYGGAIGLTYRFGAFTSSFKDTPAVYPSIEPPSSSQGRYVRAEAMHVRFDHGSTPLTTADDDVSTGIGREINSNDLSDDGTNGVRASLNLPSSAGDIILSGSWAATTSGQKAFADADARTSPAYTFATTNSADPTHSVGVSLLQLEHDQKIAHLNAKVAIPVFSSAVADFAFTAGAGGRYYGASLNSITYADADDVAGADNQINRVSIEADNLMLGPNIGIAASIPLTHGAVLSGIFNAGFYANWSSAKRTFASDDDTTNTSHANAHSVSFARSLELRARLEIPISERVNVTGSAFLNRIDGITDAAEQYALAANSKTDIESEAHLTTYGATLGVTIRLD